MNEHQGGASLCPQARSRASASYPCIDLFKFICALLVCAAHFAPLPEGDSTLMHYVNQFIQYYICRITVPFYFLCSGFFLFRKMELERFDAERVRQYCFKILRQLGTWFLILFRGTNMHLWYLTALVVAVLCVSFFLKRQIRFRAIALLAIVLYTIGMLGDTYYGLLTPLQDFKPLDYGLRAYFKLFSSTRNGLFMGFIYVFLGAVFAHRHIRMSKLLAWIGFAVSMLLMLAEVTLLLHYDIPKGHNMFLFALPASCFLFYIALHTNLKDRRIYGRLRIIGVLLFFSHMLVKDLLKLAFVAIRSLMGLDLSNFLFPLAFVAALGFALLLEQLSYKPKFKFLKYLYS